MFSVLRSPFSVLLLAIVASTVARAQEGNPVITITSVTYNAATGKYDVTGACSVANGWSAVVSKN